MRCPDSPPPTSRVPFFTPLGRLVRRHRLGAGSILILALFLLAWAFYLEPASLSVVEHSIEVTEWRGRTVPIVVALLADLHIGSPHNGVDRLARVVEATHAAGPDLILLAGDFTIHGVLGGDPVSPEEMVAGLSRFEAPLGVYAVLGNHDWWTGASRVEAALDSAGITVLDDEAVRIERAGEEDLWLVGISDAWEGRHDIGKAFSTVPEGVVSLAFTHNPDLFPHIPARAGLTLAGHTHGGQVCLPVVGRPVVPSRYGQRYAIGHVVEQGRQLFVTPGIGTSILPVRFRVPPEISILTLR